MYFYRDIFSWNLCPRHGLFPFCRFLHKEPPRTRHYTRVTSVANQEIVRFVKQCDYEVFIDTILFLIVAYAVCVYSVWSFTSALPFTRHGRIHEARRREKRLTSVGWGGGVRRGGKSKKKKKLYRQGKKTERCRDWHLRKGDRFPRYAASERGEPSPRRVQQHTGLSALFSNNVLKKNSVDKVFAQ